MGLVKSYPMKSMVITSPFGLRTHPVSGKTNSFHNGADYKAPIGTPLYAIADGRVAVSKVNSGGVSKGYGYYQVIDHDGFSALYGHMRSLFLRKGETVKAGDLVGFSGISGGITGPHLHFEIRLNNYSSSFWLKKSNGQFINSTNPQQFLVEDEGSEIDMDQEVSVWAEKAQKYVVKEGISDGSRPKDIVTREELWTMIFRTLQLIKFI